MISKKRMSNELNSSRYLLLKKTIWNSVFRYEHLLGLWYTLYKPIGVFLVLLLGKYKNFVILPRHTSLLCVFVLCFTCLHCFLFTFLQTEKIQTVQVYITRFTPGNIFRARFHRLLCGGAYFLGLLALDYWFSVCLFTFIYRYKDL